MKKLEEYCDNPYCEANAAIQTFISVKTAGDEQRSLCKSCQEVFNWGIQHGYFMAVLKGLV